MNKIYKVKKNAAGHLVACSEFAKGHTKKAVLGSLLIVGILGMATTASAQVGNTKSGKNAHVGGGGYNEANGDHPTIGGGLFNQATGNPLPSVVALITKPKAHTLPSVVVVITKPKARTLPS